MDRTAGMLGSDAMLLSRLPCPQAAEHVFVILLRGELKDFHLRTFHQQSLLGGDFHM